MEFPDNFRWLIAGVTGSGKSYFTGYLMEEARRQKRRFVILDTKMNNLRSLGQLNGVAEVRIQPGAAYNFFRVLSKDFIIFYPTEKCTTPELIDQYRLLLDVIYNNDSDRIVVVEEAHHLVSQWNLDPTVELLVREGRGKKLSVIFTTQRIQDFSKLIWSQCDRTYIFKWFIPQDIAYISRMIPDFEEINRQLREHDILEYNHKTGEHRIIKREDIKRITPHLG